MIDGIGELGIFFASVHVRHGGSMDDDIRMCTIDRSLQRLSVHNVDRNIDTRPCAMTKANHHCTSIDKLLSQVGA